MRGCWDSFGACALPARAGAVKEKVGKSASTIECALTGTARNGRTSGKERFPAEMIISVSVRPASWHRPLVFRSSVRKPPPCAYSRFLLLARRQRVGCPGCGCHARPAGRSRRSFPLAHTNTYPSTLPRSPPRGHGLTDAWARNSYWLQIMASRRRPPVPEGPKWGVRTAEDWRPSQSRKTCSREILRLSRPTSTSSALSRCARK